MLELAAAVPAATPAPAQQQATKHGQQQMSTKTTIIMMTPKMTPTMIHVTIVLRPEGSIYFKQSLKYETLLYFLLTAF